MDYLFYAFGYCVQLSSTGIVSPYHVSIYQFSPLVIDIGKKLLGPIVLIHFKHVYIHTLKY